MFNLDVKGGKMSCRCFGFFDLVFKLEKKWGWMKKEKIKEEDGEFLLSFWFLVNCVCDGRVNFLGNVLLINSLSFDLLFIILEFELLLFFLFGDSFVWLWILLNVLIVSSFGGWLFFILVYGDEFEVLCEDYVFLNNFNLVGILILVVEEFMKMVNLMSLDFFVVENNRLK